MRKFMYYLFTNYWNVEGLSDRLASAFCKLKWQMDEMPSIIITYVKNHIKIQAITEAKRNKYAGSYFDKYL